MLRKVITIMLWITFLRLAGAGAQGVWVGADAIAKKSELKAVIVDKEALYLATRSGVYKSDSSNKQWKGIFFLPQGGGNEITCLAGRAKYIFVGTKRGLFRSQDRGVQWDNVFRTIVPEKSNIAAVGLSTHNSKRVLIGTGKGVFISDDSGQRWRDISGILKNRPISNLAFGNSAIYAAGPHGVYVKKDGMPDWERVSVRSPSEMNAEEEENIAEDGTDEEHAIHCIAVKGDRVYASLRRRVTCTDSGGKAWIELSHEGLSGDIQCILPSLKSEKIYCATTKGVFEFLPDQARWLELYKGMDRSVDARRIIFADDEEKAILAVTDKGLYRMEGGDYIINHFVDIEKGLKTLKITFDGEPGFKELQQAAIRYAEVGPEKIKAWRKEARLRAFLPKVSVGLDKNRSTNYEIYTSATKDYVAAGPDDVSGGWDVSCAWELGDLIWSDDQTNIDVRSRLMVQLRNDILDDLRRVYYERKRIQFELMTEQPKDAKLRFEKELRLQELTQAIDDLTGNYFTDHIRNIEK